MPIQPLQLYLASQAKAEPLLKQIRASTTSNSRKKRCNQESRHFKTNFISDGVHSWCSQMEDGLILLQDGRAFRSLGNSNFYFAWIEKSTSVMTGLDIIKSRAHSHLHLCFEPQTCMKGRILANDYGSFLPTYMRFSLHARKIYRKRKKSHSLSITFRLLTEDEVSSNSLPQIFYLVVYPPTFQTRALWLQIQQPCVARG